MTQQLDPAHLKRLHYVRQALNRYHEIIGTLTYLVTLRIEDADYDASNKLDAVLKLVATEEFNRAGVARVEETCGMKFDFASCRKLVNLMQSGRKFNYERVLGKLRRVRERIIGCEEAMGRQQHPEEIEES